MVLFADDAGSDGEQRTYLVWDYIEVPLRMEGGENTEFMEKGD